MLTVLQVAPGGWTAEEGQKRSKSHMRLAKKLGKGSFHRGCFTQTYSDIHCSAPARGVGGLPVSRGVVVLAGGRGQVEGQAVICLLPLLPQQAVEEEQGEGG